MIPGLNALRVHNVLLFTAGVLTVLAAYAHNFTTAALYAGFCGFAIGMPIDMNFVAYKRHVPLSLSLVAPHMSLLPSVICDCVGLDRYTTAFGILFLFRGVTSMIGPPAAGSYFDRRRSLPLSAFLSFPRIPQRLHEKVRSRLRHRRCNDHHCFILSLFHRLVRTRSAQNRRDLREGPRKNPS